MGTSSSKGCKSTLKPAVLCGILSHPAEGLVPAFQSCTKVIDYLVGGILTASVVGPFVCGAPTMKLSIERKPFLLFDISVAGR